MKPTMIVLATFVVTAWGAVIGVWWLETFANISLLAGGPGGPTGAVVIALCAVVVIALLVMSPRARDVVVVFSVATSQAVFWWHALSTPGV